MLHGKERISSLNGKAFSIPEDINISPTLGIDNAIAITIESIPDYVPDLKDQFDIFSGERSKAELVILPTQDGYRLCYHVSIHSSLIDRWEYFIDADSGNIIDSYQSICKFHNHSLKEMELDMRRYLHTSDISAFKYHGEFFKNALQSAIEAVED